MFDLSMCGLLYQLVFSIALIDFLSLCFCLYVTDGRCDFFFFIIIHAAN